MPLPPFGIIVFPTRSNTVTGSNMLQNTPSSPYWTGTNPPYGAGVTWYGYPSINQTASATNFLNSAPHQLPAGYSAGPYSVTINVYAPSNIFRGTFTRKQSIVNTNAVPSANPVIIIQK